MKIDIPLSHESLSMPMVQIGTYKPEWAKNYATNNAHLLELLANTTTRDYATFMPAGIKPKVLLHTKLSPMTEEYYVHSIFRSIDLIQYCVKIEHIKIDGIRSLSTLSQTSVWRNKEMINLPHIATWVFEKVLLPKNGNILSDSIQSAEGKDFWITRMADVFAERKYKVYALGIEKVSRKYICEEAHLITTIEEADEYYTEEPDYAGMFYRLLITKQTL